MNATNNNIVHIKSHKWFPIWLTPHIRRLVTAKLWNVNRSVERKYAIEHNYTWVIQEWIGQYIADGKCNHGYLYTLWMDILAHGTLEMLQLFLSYTKLDITIDDVHWMIYQKIANIRIEDVDNPQVIIHTIKWLKENYHCSWNQLFRYDINCNVDRGVVSAFLRQGTIPLLEWFWEQLNTMERQQIICKNSEILQNIYDNHFGLSKHPVHLRSRLPVVQWHYEKCNGEWSADIKAWVPYAVKHCLVEGKRDYLDWFTSIGYSWNGWENIEKNLTMMLIIQGKDIQTAWIKAIIRDDVEMLEWLWNHMNENERLYVWADSENIIAECLTTKSFNCFYWLINHTPRRYMSLLHHNISNTSTSNLTK